MSIIGDIFLASGAIASAYLASKSLAHRKSVEANAIVVKDGDEIGIKVFNTGKNPILITGAPGISINYNKKNIISQYLNISSPPILLEPEDSKLLYSSSPTAMTFLGYITFRDFEGNSKDIQIEESHPRFNFSGIDEDLQKEYIKAGIEISKEAIVEPPENDLEKGLKFFDIDRDLTLQMDVEEFREELKDQTREL
jgi:hypothetical protein